MSRKRSSFTVSIAPGEQEKLEELARRHGCMWGDEPSVSRLLSAIAKGDLEVRNKNTWTCPICGQGVDDCDFTKHADDDGPDAQDAFQEPPSEWTLEAK